MDLEGVAVRRKSKKEVRHDATAPSWYQYLLKEKQELRMGILIKDPDRRAYMEEENERMMKLYEAYAKCDARGRYDPPSIGTKRLTWREFHDAIGYVPRPFQEQEQEALL